MLLKIISLLYQNVASYLRSTNWLYCPQTLLLLAFSVLSDDWKNNLFIPFFPHFFLPFILISFGYLELESAKFLSQREILVVSSIGLMRPLIKCWLYNITFGTRMLCHELLRFMGYRNSTSIYLFTFVCVRVKILET